MQRNENKLEKARKKEEDVDKRLRDAGMYEEGLSMETKLQLLQFLEESRESARQEEAERKNLQRWEQSLTEAIYQANLHEKSGGSSNASTRVEELEVEEAAGVSVPAGQRTTESGRSSSPESDVVLEPVSKSSSNSLPRQHLQAADEDEDLFLLTPDHLDDPECQVIRTSTKESSSTAVEASQLARRKYPENAKHTSGTPSSNPHLSPMDVSPIVGRSRTTPTKASTSTVMAGNGNNSNTASLSHGSPTMHHKKLPNPHVLLVPLTHASSPVKNTVPSPKKDLTAGGSGSPSRKNAVSSHKQDLTPAGSAFSGRKNVMPSPDKNTSSGGSTTTARKELVFSRENVSSHNSTLTNTGDSPSFQKNFTASPRNSSHSSRSSHPTFDSVPSRSLPLTGTLTPSKDVSTPTSLQKSVTPSFNKNSIPSIRKNLASSLVEDLSPAMNDTFTDCPSGASITTSTSSTITTTTTVTTPSHTASTSTTTTTTTLEREVGEPGSLPNDSIESDLENKTSLRAAVLRRINVFSHSKTKEVLLRQKRPLFSEQASKAFHLVPAESPQQCRNRILALMDNMATCLQQYQTSLPALMWSRPLTVDRQLRDSLDKPRPASRQRRQRQQVEEEMEREGFKQRHTRQATKLIQETPNAHPDPCRGEGTSRGHRLGRGKTLGLRRGKRPATLPLPVVTSDTDSDLEIGCANSFLPAQSQDLPLPSYVKAGGTVPAAKNKLESQPQQRTSRKTFRLNSSSEGSDNEFSVEVDGTRIDNHTSSRVSPGRKDAPPSPTNSLSELYIIEGEQSHSSPPKLARPAIKTMTRRGTRRPALEPTGSVPPKLRKTHTLNKEHSSIDGNPQQDGTHPQPHSSNSTHTLEDASEWSSDTRQNQEKEEEQEEPAEKVPCPICQRLFPLQEIEVHASDCVEMEEDSQEQQQQQQQQALYQGTRRLRRLNEESIAAELSTSDKARE